MLNALGQSTYEGVQFLKGLVQTHGQNWSEFDKSHSRPLIYKSVRNVRFGSNDEKSSPIYLARADGVMYNVEKKLAKTI